MAESDFLSYFSNCHVHTGMSVWGECVGQEGPASNPSAVFTPGTTCPWGKTGKDHNTSEPSLADTKPRSAQQPSPMSMGQKMPFFIETLGSLSQLSNSPAVLYFEISTRCQFLKSHLCSPSSNPTSESNMMLHGDTSVIPTPPGTI